MAVYLDYNATTPVDPQVQKIICLTLAKNWGNPSSSYTLGKDAQIIVQNSREKVAGMVNCCADEIIFTSGGTESNNMVIHTAVRDFNSRDFGCPKNYKPHIITTNIEHDSVKLPLEALSASGKIEVTFVPVSKTTGAVEVNSIMDAVRPNTCLVTIMLANNETGVLQPLKELSSQLMKLNALGSPILLHSDAAQAIGKIKVDVEELDIDYLTIVGHKFYGPRIGALYSKRGKPLYPLFYGGGQERNFRPGTENTCMIAGLGEAADLVNSNLNVYEIHMSSIRDYLAETLKKTFGDKISFNVDGNDVSKLPNTLSVAFDISNLTGYDLLNEAKMICASTAAACHSKKGASSILLASGVSKEFALKTLRLSVGRETTKDDINKAVKILQNAIEKLYSMTLNNVD